MNQVKETYDFTRAKIAADRKRKLKRFTTYLVIGGLSGFLVGWWMCPDVVPFRVAIFLGGVVMGPFAGFSHFGNGGES